MRNSNGTRRIVLALMLLLVSVSAYAWDPWGDVRKAVIDPVVNTAKGAFEDTSRGFTEIFHGKIVDGLLDIAGGALRPAVTVANSVGDIINRIIHFFKRPPTCNPSH